MSGYLMIREPLAGPLHASKTRPHPRALEVMNLAGFVPEDCMSNCLQSVWKALSLRTPIQGR